MGLTTGNAALRQRLLAGGLTASASASPIFATPSGARPIFSGNVVHSTSTFLEAPVATTGAGGIDETPPRSARPSLR